jgi:RNA polymerase sigma factor (sigma-70 family)
MPTTNTELFTSLHRDYYAMVLQVCKGFVKGDMDIAKDLTQDVFVNTWNALEKFKGASSYKTWIYRITVNTCLKHIRDRKDQEKISIEKMQHHPAEKPASDGATHELYGPIGQLAEVDRLIIMMVLDELDYEEIAAVMGISSVNLRVKIHRIKKQLKQILDHD